MNINKTIKKLLNFKSKNQSAQEEARQTRHNLLSELGRENIEKGRKIKDKKN